MCLKEIAHPLCPTRSHGSPIFAEMDAFCAMCPEVESADTMVGNGSYKRPHDGNPSLTSVPRHFFISQSPHRGASATEGNPFSVARCEKRATVRHNYGPCFYKQGYAEPEK